MGLMKCMNYHAPILLDAPPIPSPTPAALLAPTGSPLLLLCHVYSPALSLLTSNPRAPFSTLMIAFLVSTCVKIKI